MRSKITALVVMPCERRQKLLEQLDAAGGIDLLTASNCKEACTVLGRRGTIHVVITDRQLPDGDWRRLLAETARSCPSTQAIVCSRHVDYNFWIDALESGVYDVFVEPYQAEEIRRILESAADMCEMRSHAPGKTQHSAGAAAGGRFAAA